MATTTQSQPANDAADQEPLTEEQLRAQVRAELEKEVRDEVGAEFATKQKALDDERESLDASIEEFNATQESAKNIAANDAKKVKNPLSAEDKKILVALKEDGANADKVAGALKTTREKVVQVAYSNMNNESVYELAERLNVKVNDVYEMTGQDDMVRYQESEGEDGKRVKSKLDYEA